MSFYDNASITTSQDERTDYNKDPAKIKKIIEIKNDGLEVIHIIQRWGMSKDTALEVEAAFIDYLGLEYLTNIVNGNDPERGMCLADKLEKRLTADTFTVNNNDKFILIKITDYSLNRHNGNVYETVRASWKIDPKKARNYPIVLAVNNSIVVGVYEVIGDWKKDPIPGRYYFDGKEAPLTIKNKYLNKKIPDRFRKHQNPISYSN